MLTEVLHHFLYCYFTFEVESNVDECWGFYCEEGKFWFETPNRCHGLYDSHSDTLEWNRQRV